MNNRKNIIISALLISLAVGFAAAEASSSNNLLQMDVKKSSAANSVDVTFYTTADAANSIVTRKANNKYVVLLPNISGSGSVVPGLGGVKDLITNVDVKNVNDGIGGYTKVTFETTKPVNIKTYMKKTAPLTQAQKDYHNLIAQNNKPAVQNTSSKPAEQNVAVKKQPSNNNIVPAKQPVQQTKTNEVKPTQQNTSKPAAKPAVKTDSPKVSSLPKISFTPISVPKAKIESKPVQPKIVQHQPEPVQQPKVVQTPLAKSFDNYVPKMKFDESGKRQIDLEPRVSHKVVKDDNQNSSPVINEENTLPVEEQNVLATTQNESQAVETPLDKNTSKNSGIPLWLLICGGAALGLVVLFLVFDAITHSSKKDADRLNSFFNLSSKEQKERQRNEFQEIIEDSSLNWQEKYKKYSEKDKELHPVNNSDLNYVTNMSASKKAIISSENNSTPIAKKDSLNKKLRAKISQMEHSLAQTPTAEPVEFSNEVRSEDDVITKKFSNIKLKSFAKAVTLRETNRTLMDDDIKPVKKSAAKEGRFVKLKSSPLSVSARKHAYSKSNATNVMNNSRYINNGVMNMDNLNENYSVGSLDEYMSILDTEENTVTNRSASANTVSSRVTSPISHSSNPMMTTRPHSSMNSMVVKSSYNIDSEKGFYLVDIDGVSALVGKNKEDICVLKKFDRKIDKQIQVRKDYGSVYIVKVEGYKCLVDVSKEKMGTLIEI